METPNHDGRREKRAKADRLRRREDLRGLMDDARGRRFVWALLGDAGLFRSSMAHTAELTAFYEGRRDTGLVLLAELMRLCPGQYALMQAEAAPQTIFNGENDDRPDDDTGNA